MSTATATATVSGTVVSSSENEIVIDTATGRQRFVVERGDLDHPHDPCERHPGDRRVPHPRRWQAAGCAGDGQPTSRCPRRHPVPPGRSHPARDREPVGSRGPAWPAVPRGVGSRPRLAALVLARRPRESLWQPSRDQPGQRARHSTRCPGSLLSRSGSVRGR
jgi:hypothetical protein